MTLRDARRLGVLLVVLATAGSCGDDDERSIDPTVPTASSTTSTTSAMSVAQAIPVELQGGWETTFEDGSRATLRLRETGYQVTRPGASGSGSVGVTDDVMIFSTPQCSVEGAYRWSLEGDSLTLTLVGDDPCPRSAVLAGRTFVRDQA